MAQELQYILIQEEDQLTFKQKDIEVIFLRMSSHAIFHNNF